MRHHGPPGHHRRPPIGWMLARGIHRTVLAFLVLAGTLGVLGASVISACYSAGLPIGVLICGGFAVFFSFWPLAWMATMRIAWPLRNLAASATQLREGRLAAREELPDGPGEVGEVADALRGMADRVARQLHDQRALMAAVSHELRSPLARARVLVEMGREGGPVHDELQAEIDTMDSLVGDLLAAARIDFEAVSPRPTPASTLATRAVEAEGVGSCVVEGDAEVNADPTLLVRALQNLLGNARRYGGTQVTLRVRSRAEFVRLLVEDDGPGIPVGDEDRIFTPFYRGAHGEGAPGGVGLGLALVRQIAQAHGGEAGAFNRPEGGACVWIELPRVREA